jgi:hypothetical protein
MPPRLSWRRGQADRGGPPTSGCRTRLAGGSSLSNAGTRSATSARPPGPATGSGWRRRCRRLRRLTGGSSRRRRRPLDRACDGPEPGARRSLPGGVHLAVRRLIRRWAGALTEGATPPADGGPAWCALAATRVLAWRRPPRCAEHAPSVGTRDDRAVGRGRLIESGTWRWRQDPVPVTSSSVREIRASPSARSAAGGQPKPSRKKERGRSNQ